MSNTHLINEVSDDISDDSYVESDEENYGGLVKRMQKIKEKKQELIKKLKLHDAALNLNASFRMHSANNFPSKKKPTTVQKRKQGDLYKSLPRRKSLRLLKIEASVYEASSDVQLTEENMKVQRIPTSEHSLKESSPATDETSNSIQMENSFLDHLSKSFEKIPKFQTQTSSFTSSLSNMTKNGSIYKKVVDNRIFSMAIHDRTDILLVAAGAKNGQIGLWKITERENFNQDNSEDVYSFNTYPRTISRVAFPSSKENSLFFSSYSGAVRSIDLHKVVFDQCLIDNEDLDISTFEIQDLSNNVVFAGCYNGDLVICDSRMQLRNSSYDLHDRVIKSISVHPLQNNYFVTSSNDCLVKIFDFRFLKKKSNPVCLLSEHARTVDSAYFSPISGRKLLTTSLDDRLRIFDTSILSETRLKCVAAHNNNTGRWLSNFRAIWHPSCEDVIAIGSMARPTRQIDIYDSNLDKIYTLNDEENFTTVCSLLAIHPHRHVIVGGNSSGKVFSFEG